MHGRDHDRVAGRQARRTDSPPALSGCGHVALLSFPAQHFDALAYQRIGSADDGRPARPQRKSTDQEGHSQAHYRHARDERKRYLIGWGVRVDEQERSPRTKEMAPPIPRIPIDGVNISATMSTAPSKAQRKPGIGQRQRADKAYRPTTRQIAPMTPG